MLLSYFLNNPIKALIWAMKTLKSPCVIFDLANLVLNVLGMKFTMRLSAELTIKFKLNVRITIRVVRRKMGVLYLNTTTPHEKVGENVTILW